jgi:hypothetical protein
MRTQTKPFSRLVAVVTAGALLAGGLQAGAFAAPPPFEVDLEVLTDQLLGAQVQIHEGGQAGLERLLLSAEFLEWRRQHPSASGLDALDRLSARRDALQDARTAQDRVLSEPEFVMRAASVLVSDLERTAAGATHIRALIDAALGKSVAAFDTREDLVSGSLRGTQWLRARSQVEAGVWSAVRRQAVADAGFAYAWNGVLGQPVGIDATASLAQIKVDPQLRPFVDVDAILAHQGSAPEFLAEIQRQFGLVAARLASESASARARLAALSATCPVKPDAACTPEQRAAAAATASSEQKEIDAGATAAKLLGGLARIADQTSGEKIEKVATAWYSIITAINKYGEAVAGRSAEDAILSGASLVMAGDVLGAVMTLVGLLGESTPSLDQQILDQVVKLRQEVRALHEEMRDSFARIEAQLNTIFTVVLSQLDRLNAAVAGNTAALISIQNELAEQELRLESVAATILTAIGDVELHDTRSDVNQYIGYAETYGQPIPSYGEYIGPENEFHYAATEVATHTAFVVPPALADDPTVRPLDVLNSYGESSALSYLARLGHRRDPRVTDPSDAFANPSVWNFTAQAYALLQLQNPGFAAQVSPARGAQIGLEGQRILDVARSFSRETAQPDTTGDRTNAIFTGLVQDYRTALARLASRLAVLRTETQKRKESSDHGATFQAMSKTYALFGAPNQALPESVLPADFPSVRMCSPGASNPLLTRPSNVNFRSLAPELRFAFYAFSPTLQDTLRLPELSECYDLAWTGYREVTTPTYTAEYAKLRLTMRTRFRWAYTAGAPSLPDEQWRNARSLTYTWPEMRISYQCTGTHCTGNSYTTIEQALAARWPRDKALFEQSATVTLDSDLITSARTQMTAFLQGRQGALYQRAATEVYNASTPLNVAAADMSQAARQLQAYTRLGFPVALAGDDILSSLLFGRYPLPSNAVTDPQVERTLTIAFNRYACVPSVTVGNSCFGGPFYPLGNQPYLETIGGVTPTQPITCAVSGGPGLPGDPVGDCLVASATQRLNALAGRYRHHSQLLAAGVYVEQLPFVASTLATLPLVDTIVRTPAAN